jgi:Ser/Thr protein kinase RdoA (MazF antagonist)
MVRVNAPSLPLHDILGRFDLPGATVSVARHGSGLINDTWLCVRAAGGADRRFILQRVNRSVFPRPGQVMENLEAVTGHVRERLLREGVGDPCGHSLCLIRTRDGRSWHVDGRGECWRMFPFIENGVAYDTVRSVAHGRQVGRALGRFQALVADLSPSRLHDTLPGFHLTPRYLDELREAVRQDAAGRAAGAAPEIAFAEERRRYAGMLAGPMQEGRIPLRVVHNDPKVNNVLVHRRTGAALCMLDLDTVKAGIVHFDFGDCVRSAANPAGEDAPDPDAVVFDAVCYDAVRSGYLEEASPFLLKAELDLLPAAVPVITYELGLRFLADHLRGDTYFRTDSPGQNLRRARVQFRLLRSMEQAGLF